MVRAPLLPHVSSRVGLVTHAMGISDSCKDFVCGTRCAADAPQCAVVMTAAAMLLLMLLLVMARMQALPQHRRQQQQQWHRQG